MPRSLTWLDRGKVVPEILIEFKSESMDSFLEVPNRMASDLEGLRANQLWENQKCKSETGFKTVFEEMVLD